MRILLGIDVFSMLRHHSLLHQYIQKGCLVYISVGFRAERYVESFMHKVANGDGNDALEERIVVAQ